MSAVREDSTKKQTQHSMKDIHFVRADMAVFVSGIDLMAVFVALW